MTASTGTTTVRTNVVKNPTAGTDITGASIGSQGIGGTAALSRGTDGGALGSTYYRMTWSVAGTGGGYFNIGGTTGNFQDVTATPWTVTGWVRTSVAHNVRIAMVSHNTSAGGDWQPTSTAWTPIPANTWTKLSVTRTPGAGYLWAHIVVEISGSEGTAVGETLDASNFIMENTSASLGYFDGAIAPAIRTNLCTNPVGVAAFGPYSAAVTITPNVTVTGNPDGLTTANRVSYTSESNPGVSLKSAVVVGTQYTISAWVYHESAAPTPGTQGFAQLGVTAMPSPPAITVGSWVKLTWTYTATQTFPLGFRITAQSGGSGSFLITGVLIEESAAVGTFFAGSTSASNGFTYAWTGTANASSSVIRSADFTNGWNGTAQSSTSYLRAPNVQGWSGRWFGSTGGTGAQWQSTENPLSGPFLRRQWLCANTGASQDTGIALTTRVPAVAGTTYTASIMARSSEAQHITVWFEFFDAGGATLGASAKSDQGTLTPNVWTRFSFSAVAPANTATVQVVPGPYANAIAMPAGATVDFDQCIIEASPTVGSYFDGLTGASGDYTYTWNGLGQASSSTQWAANVSGVGANRNGSILDGRFFVFQGTAEDGKKTAKWFSPAGTASSGWRIANINGSSTVGFTVGPIKAGGQYTLWMRYRGSGWGSTQTLLVSIADGTSLNAVIGNDTVTPLLNTTTWQEYRRTFTALRDATAASVIYLTLPALPQTATDGIFELREWMLVEGAYTGDYIDGTKPFAKWDGTVNASTSIGYPQQLLDIAGKPAADVTAPGTYALSGGVDPTLGRTIYTVSNLLADIPLGNNYVMALYGDAALNDTVPNTFLTLRYQSETGATSTLLNRRTGGGGPQAGGVRLGVNVACWGLKNQYQYVAEGGRAEVVDTAALSIDHEALQITSASPMHSHIRTLVYLGYHDNATRLAISRYLGNKYGSNVA